MSSKGRSLLEGLGWALVLSGLTMTTLFRVTVSSGTNFWGYLFLTLFALLYLGCFSRYRRQNQEKIFFKFHLWGIFLLFPVGLASWLLTSLLALLFLGSQDLGVPMIAGLLLGIFFLLLFPLLFTGLLAVSVILLRRKFFPDLSLSESWRLNSLGVGAFMVLLYFLFPAQPTYLPPEILRGPALTLLRLPTDRGHIIYGVLPQEHLKGLEVRKVALLPHLPREDPTYEELLRTESLSFYETPLSRGVFLESSFPVKELGETPFLMVHTFRPRFMRGPREGPILLLPIRTSLVSEFFRLREVSWKKEPHPSLNLKIETLIPIEPLQACFNFNRRLGLRQGQREIYFQGGPTLVQKREGREFLCYFLRPLSEENLSEAGYLKGRLTLNHLASEHLLGTFRLCFPLLSEDFKTLFSKRAPSSPIKTAFFLVARPGLFHLRPQKRIYSPIFEFELPPPRNDNP